MLIDMGEQVSLPRQAAVPGDLRGLARLPGAHRDHNRTEPGPREHPPGDRARRRSAVAVPGRTAASRPAVPSVRALPPAPLLADHRDDGRVAEPRRSVGAEHLAVPSRTSTTPFSAAITSGASTSVNGSIRLPSQSGSPGRSRPRRLGSRPCRRMTRSLAAAVTPSRRAPSEQAMRGCCDGKEHGISVPAAPGVAIRERIPMLPPC
jgi:hypothetical protein